MLPPSQLERLPDPGPENPPAVMAKEAVGLDLRTHIRYRDEFGRFIPLGRATPGHDTALVWWMVVGPDGKRVRVTIGEQAT